MDQNNQERKEPVDKWDWLESEAPEPSGDPSEGSEPWRDVLRRIEEHLLRESEESLKQDEDEDRRAEASSDDTEIFSDPPQTDWDAEVAAGTYGSKGRSDDEDWDFTDPHSLQELRDPGTHSLHPDSSYSGIPFSTSIWQYASEPDGGGFRKPGQPLRIPSEPENIPKASVFDAIATTWRVLLRSPIPWLIVAAICLGGIIVAWFAIWGVIIFFMLYEELNPNVPIYEQSYFPLVVGVTIAVALLVWLLLAFVTALTYRTAIVGMRGKELQIRDVLRFKNLHFRGLLGLQLLIIAGVAVGLVLLVIPGIFVALCSTVATAHYYLRPELGPVEALKRGLKTGARSPLTFIWFLFVFLHIDLFLSVTLFGIGLVIPITAMKAVYLAMLSLRERPALMDEAEYPFGDE